MAATLADVAKKIGCSSSTVSRTMSGTGQVRRELREAILEAARELDYRPRASRPPAGAGRGETPTARAIDVILHHRSPFERVTVDEGGLAVGPLSPYDGAAMLSDDNRYSSTYDRRVLDGILVEAGRLKRRVSIQVTTDLADPDLIAEFSAGDKAVILMGEYPEEPLDRVVSIRAPMVLLDLMVDRGAPVVTIENALGTSQALAHLLSLGHKRIGFAAGPPRITAYRERRAAFLAGMVDAGLSINNTWMYEGPEHICHTTEWAYDILGKRDRPSALLCASDSMALAVVQAAGRRKLAVPEKLSVVGFDDIELAALMSPPLTTVRSPFSELGRHAVQQLILRLDGAHNERVVVRVVPELVVRSSTAKPKRS